MASCGATSAYGSQGLRKTARLMGASRRLPVERGELLQDVVAPRHRVVEALLRRPAPAEDVLYLLFDGIADGVEVPEANALAVGRRLPGVHLDDRGLLVRVLHVVARGFQCFGGAVGERQVAGHARPPRLVLGGGDVLEELRDTLVLVRLPAAHHPERGPADDRIPLWESREPRERAG